MLVIKCPAQIHVEVVRLVPVLQELHSRATAVVALEAEIPAALPLSHTRQISERGVLSFGQPLLNEHRAHARHGSHREAGTEDLLRSNGVDLVLDVVEFA